ncbi:MULTISPECIES: hypothetical protein [Acidiphilium]|uniref:Uncharacterized protein n=1 Tax=Acidiphilium rubrum TaxID=526 RepID=A0A8G2FCH8_ACIRU|nr:MULTISPECIES: hypothetical protein [Acidiphilium]MBW4037024.1 hypothetical protein [Pseudomonadota bacterium]SIQ37933.1 hypothetical protein SAMN05421828_10446 [Acidiphilium rubrum]
MTLPIGARTNIDEEVARLKRGIARKLVYAGLADVLLLWGMIFLVNDALVLLAPRASILTLAVGVAGLFGTWSISQVRARSPAHAENAQKLFWCFVAFFGWIVLWQGLGIPAPLNGLSLDQQNAAVLFQITFIMLGLLILGIWVGWELIAVGLAVPAIVILDHLLAAPGQFIGIAILTAGLGLLAAGLWMRLTARDIKVDPLAVTR